ncbi:MAG: pitrilysin family protein [Candidatus Solibacter sp.]|jgi:zinc protease
MKTWLGMLLLVASARAQSDAIPGLGRQPAAPPAAGRGRGAATAPAAAGGVSVGSPKDLRYPPLRAIQAPDFAVFTLPNGIKLYLREDHDLPVVGGVALVRTGTLLDPPQRTGLAQLAGIALRTGGTSLKTGDQIDTLLDNLASTVESSIGDSYGTFSFGGLKENAPATLQLFKEILTQPGFRPDKIEIAKTQLRVAVSHRNDSAGAIADREFARLVYGKDSPYGRQVEYATLNRVSRGDLRAFHQRYFFPANVMLGVWGDFNSAEMKASLEKLFADWTVRQEPAPQFEKVKNAPSPGVFLAEKKDAAQTFFTIGHLGGQRDDKDYAALEILAGILGGARSRIAARLRTTLDMTAAWNADYAQTGLFEVSGSVNSLFTVETINAIREEIERLRTAEVADDEWRKAREAAVDRLVFADQTRARLFAHQMILDYWGYPKDYLQRYQNALQSVTRADLLRVAKQYLNPASLTMVVAANPTMFGEPLEKLGPVTRLDVAIPEAKPEAVESSDASLAEGKRMLLKAQAAAGGAEKLAAVKDYTVITEYAVDPAVAGVGGSKVVQTERWVAPSTLRQDATLPAGRVTLYTDGKLGWLSNPQGWGGLAGVQRARAFGDLFRVYYRLLLSDRLEGRTVNAIDDSTVQIGDPTGQVASLEFDAVTHLAKRLSWDAPQDGGASLYHEEVYDDFRDAGGIEVPFKITVNEGGRKFADVVVKDYKINTGLNPLELARRTP